MPVFYYGADGRIGMALEFMSSDLTTVSFGKAETIDATLSWPRGMTVSVDENVTREYFVGQTTGRDADESIKGIHEVTGSMTFWLPNDMDATPSDEIFWLKLPIDGINMNWTDGTSFGIPSAAHGTNVLQSWNMEIGHSRSGSENPRWLAVSGCMCSSFTMRARAGERIECSLDWQGKGVDWKSAATSAVTRSTTPPAGFEDCTIQYGTSGSVSTLNECTAFEFTIDNNLIANYGLADQGNRVLRDIIPGKRDITGTLTVHMASGNVTNDLYADVLSGTTPSNYVANKSIEFTVEDLAGTGSFTLAFYNVILGELSMDIDPTKVQELSVPFGAEEVMLKIYPSAQAVSANQPTNWDVL